MIYILYPPIWKLGYSLFIVKLSANKFCNPAYLWFCKKCLFFGGMFWPFVEWCDQMNRYCPFYNVFGNKIFHLFYCHRNTTNSPSKFVVYFLTAIESLNICPCINICSNVNISNNYSYISTNWYNFPNTRKYL